MADEENPIKVLLVDDEVNILNSCQRTLRKEEYEVLITTSPDEAIQLVSFNKFAVVISDQMMPEMTGTFLLEKIKQASPETVRIILTGHADVEAALDSINRGGVFRFLTKPWNDDEFRLVVRQAVSHYKLVEENARLLNLTREQNEELRSLTQHLEQKVIQRTEEISGLMLQLEQSLLGTVQVLATVAEIHSQVIGSHSRRVAALSREIGIRMGLSGTELMELEIAGKLHDLGKMVIPPEILSKSEALLSQDEKDLLLNHVITGAAMVRTIPGIGNTPLLIKHHHEKIDGSGFPDGLKGREIPLGSRIIAVVSAFDRALNIRSIFQTTTSDMALLTVQSRCPNDLDPKIVQVLTHCIEQRRSEKGEEAEICVRDLLPGMTISRDVRTAQGILLLQKDSLVDEQTLEKLYAFQQTNPFADILYVYRMASPIENQPMVSPGGSSP